MSPKERPGSPRTRLFLALELPADYRAELAAWREGALVSPDLRLPPEEHLHATLVFLGWQNEKDIPAIASAAFSAIEGLAAPVMSGGGVEAVPRRRPRLFALDLEDPAGAAGAVQAAAAGALETAGFYVPEKRPFWPHVTLARVKRGRRAPRLDIPSPPPGPFEAPTVTLYRSTLRPQGALYEPLERHQMREASI